MVYKISSGVWIARLQIDSSKTAEMNMWNRCKYVTQAPLALLVKAWCTQYWQLPVWNITGFFLGLRCNFLKATIMSYLQVTVYLPTTPNGALSSSMFSEALTDNNSKRHFFRKIVAKYWKNCVLSFLRRWNEPYSSVVICVSAPRRCLLCCCERRLDISRQATENPVTECPLTR